MSKSVEFHSTQHLFYIRRGYTLHFAMRNHNSGLLTDSIVTKKEHSCSPNEQPEVWGIIEKGQLRTGYC